MTAKTSLVGARLSVPPSVLRLLALALFAVAPFVLSTFRLSLLAEVLVYGTAAASLSLLLGFTGLPSLGHAAFFGLGAYTAGLLAVHVTDLAVIGLLLAVLLSAAVAAPTGWLATRTHGIFFLMLTLALGEIVHSVAISWSTLTGGTNGLAGIPAPGLVPGLNGSPWTAKTSYYYVLVAAVLAYVLLAAVLRSPFGHSLVGIRENEARMQALGYKVARYKLASFVLAAGVGGYAGALYAHSVRFVSPSLLDLESMVFLFVMPLLGGIRHLWGAIIGAGLVVFARHELTSRFDEWEFGLGVLLIVVVIASPEAWRQVVRRRSNRSDRSHQTAIEEVSS
ncbi:branched-chain amino acid ABC transporter permease [Nitriliruptoraceae bacterium ZYF776]|nr:branched-chain amino acid ABC transporter permease [Profundirhabdus halotolerans]